MLAHEVGLSTGRMDATAGDKALKDERTTYTREGEKEPGFASAVVPTLEERVVAEKTEDATLRQASDRESEGRTATGELYGAPADAKPGDTEPPHGAGKTLSPEEEKAPAARSLIRENLTAAHDTSGAWTLPTPAPHIDPNGFDDPLSDAFWKDTWLAAAVHNVRFTYTTYTIVSLKPELTIDGDLPQGLPCYPR
jgi:phospholipase D1/2